jgi:hypothetical protein
MERLEHYHSIEYTPDQLGTECSICLQVCEKNIVETKCSHLFHKECIDEWIKRSYSCPLCRYKFSRLSWGNYFDIPIGILPSSITYLNFGDSSGVTIDNLRAFIDC